MNLAKPSTVVGGGEMKRVTSSVVRSARSVAASVTRSSRSVKPLPCRTGRAFRQRVSIAVDVRVIGDEAVSTIWVAIIVCHLFLTTS
jgi:hypothetical protein